MAIGNPITLTSNVASKTISVIATASQTLFTVTGGYRINQLAVFRNGVRLVDGRDYTAADGSTVTLLSAATLADVLEFQIFDDFRVADAIVSAASTQTISGNLKVTGSISASTLETETGGLNLVGVVTATSLDVGDINSTGVVTATSFVGDGSNLTGVSGFATALSSSQSSPLFNVFKTPRRFTVGAGTSISIESDDTSGNIAFMRNAEVHVAVGSTFHIGSGTTLVTNVLSIF